ncbi:MAG: hypothetical protein M5U08_02345 [Burkholderiales bacterium]|nr:hypothetical protein [Burkholderiales bacterium]
MTHPLLSTRHSWRTLAEHLVMLAWVMTWAAICHAGSTVEILADFEKTTRREELPALFGFNVVWANFQIGYTRHGTPRPEVIEYLQPFRGAVYRYPGGTPSNHFFWDESIGPQSSRRPQRDEYGREALPLFGFDEFIHFVKEVGGVPLITINLVGGNGRAWSDKEVASYAASWVAYASAREGTGEREWRRPCTTSLACPVLLWELGNELDRGRHAISAAQYSARAREVGMAMKQNNPNIFLIAQTKSAPWELRARNLATPELEFNRVVARQLAKIVDGYAFHPYYDGISVPRVQNLMHEIIEDIRPRDESPGPPIPIFITEHAKWPSRPLVGRWEGNWAQTGNLGGAESTADFLLMLMQSSHVVAANWHGLGARGPWQLFYHDTMSDLVYPNVVYWAMRVLREAALPEIVRTEVRSQNLSGYRGGYDVRAVLTRDGAKRRFSVLAVNRAPIAEMAVITLKGFSTRRLTFDMSVVTGTSPEERNSNEKPFNIVPKRTLGIKELSRDGKLRVTLAPHSITAVIFSQAD